MKTESEINRHVIEMMTGNNLSGKCTLSRSELSCSIYGFDGFFVIRSSDGPVYLHTEKNEIVSLFHNLESHPGSYSRMDPPRTVYRQDITSNFALLGYQKWLPETAVKSVSFNVASARDILRHTESYRRFINSGIGGSDLVYFRHETNDYDIAIYHQGSYNIYNEHPSDDHFTIEFKYKSHRTIDSYGSDVRSFVNFLSFSAAAVFFDTDVAISDLTESEKHRLVEERRGFSNFHVYQRRSGEESENFYRNSSEDLLSLRDDDEMASFKACFSQWTEQHHTWSKAYSLMAQAFRLDGEISGERLLNACKWFEEIPGTEAQDSISSEQVEKIIAGALSVAKAVGHDDADLTTRVSGALKRVGKESRNAQVSRIVTEVNSHFGLNALSDGIVAHICRGLGPLRGSAAHSHLTTKSDKEFRALAKSISAIEALCWLLTAASLPLSPAAKVRACSHAIVLTYTESYEP